MMNGIANCNRDHFAALDQALASLDMERDILWPNSRPNQNRSSLFIRGIGKNREPTEPVP
jgi:hypothetical protein